MLFASVKLDWIKSICLYTIGDFFVTDIRDRVNSVTQSASEQCSKYKMKDKLVFQSGEET